MNPEKPIGDLAGRTAIVVGASRGLGRGIAGALAEAGAPVTAVARDPASLESLANGPFDIKPAPGDASDPAVAGRLLDVVPEDVGSSGPPWRLSAVKGNLGPKEVSG